MKVIEKYDITQCALYKCRSRKRLSEVLILTVQDLRKITTWVKYNKFSIPKEDGDDRPINAPNRKTKSVQRRILDLISKVERPDWLISGEKGKCYIDNGRFHQDSNFFLTMDIKKFYDNCKREYAYQFFYKTLKIAPDIACILTNIVTFKGGIPTGSPTSQLMAYYAYQDMFQNINNIAGSYGCKLSIYVDDITISSKIPFYPRKLSNEIDIELRRWGHKPKYKKVKYYSADEYKLITGTVIGKDHSLNVSNKLRQKIIRDLTALKDIKNGKNQISDTDHDKLISSLKGRLQAAKNVEKNIFPEINRLVKSGYFD